MSLLEIKNFSITLKRTEGDIRLVDNVSFTMQAGEIHGLIGESGSGKSLIAKAILGIPNPGWVVHANRMRWNGIDLLKLKLSERRALMGNEIAMIFQEPSSYLDPSKTIGQQLLSTIPLEKKSLFFWKNRQQRQKIAKKWLHRVGIKNHDRILKSYPWELSEGACQKIMIVMALVHQPRLLIADEPTNMMGNHTKTQILRLLSKLKQVEDLSILILHHNITELANWTDRMTILYCGQVVESSATQDLIQRPFHPYVKAQLDSFAQMEQQLLAPDQVLKLKGHIPALQYLPKGCRLGPRCPRAQKKCIDFPATVKVKNHFFACHFPLHQLDNKS
jgi:cationic peptide transport system ATP-binding protein